MVNRDVPAVWPLQLYTLMEAFCILFFFILPDHHLPQTASVHLLEAPPQQGLVNTCKQSILYIYIYTYILLTVLAPNTTPTHTSPTQKSSQISSGQPSIHPSFCPDLGAGGVWRGVVLGSKCYTASRLRGGPSRPTLQSYVIKVPQDLGCCYSS